MHRPNQSWTEDLSHLPVGSGPTISRTYPRGHLFFLQRRSQRRRFGSIWKTKPKESGWCDSERGGSEEGIELLEAFRIDLEIDVGVNGAELLSKKKKEYESRGSAASARHGGGGGDRGNESK